MLRNIVGDLALSTCGFDVFSRSIPAGETALLFCLLKVHVLLVWECS